MIKRVKKNHGVKNEAQDLGLDNVRAGGAIYWDWQQERRSGLGSVPTGWLGEVFHVKMPIRPLGLWIWNTEADEQEEHML